MKKTILIVASLSLFSLLFVMLRDDKQAGVDIRLKGDSFFEGLRIVNKKNGVPEWTIIARRADLSKDGAEATLSDVEMELHDRGVSILADRGRYNLENRNILIDGPIVARNDSYAITTEQVSIDSASGVLKTTEKVTIEGKKFTLHGQGMEIESNAQTVRILNNVQATFR